MASEKKDPFDFGTVIAFVAPGFIGLVGASFNVPLAESWLAVAADKEQTVGAFLFVFLGSLTVGITISGVRALLVDNLLKLYGLRRPSLDYSKLTDENRMRVFQGLTDNFYRYYQFYANSLVALVLTWISLLLSSNKINATDNETYVVAVVIVILLLSATDSLSKYYAGLKDLTHPVLPRK